MVICPKNQTVFLFKSKFIRKVIEMLDEKPFTLLFF